MDQPDAERVRGFRAVIESFLNERLEGKTKGNTEEDTILLAKYSPESWLADAARRASQIQAVTHTLKATHPDAKGSSLYSTPHAAGREKLVGSHLLPSDFAADVVGNAAALDVYKFLRLEFAGKTLLEWMQAKDVDLLGALHADLATAKKLVQNFLKIVEQTAEPASHTHAKQIYWFVGDDPADNSQYHLLSPLYPSSLVHQTHAVIKEHRFGEAAKEARKARKAGEYTAQALHEYPDLAEQKLGGTKPQNISQLNSERGGVNYLLASLPPLWKSRGVRPPLGRIPLFEQWGRKRSLAALVKKLEQFLRSDPDPTFRTRDLRDNMLEQIVGEVLQYAEELRALEPGWSADSRCRLAEAETLWLDPGRAAFDADFAKASLEKDWQASVKFRFASWLNHALGGSLPLGDIEHAFWAAALDFDDCQGPINSDRALPEKQGGRPCQ